MNGFFDVNERKEITAIKEVKEKEESLQNFKTIGIAGACHRIGTTTQAVQIVKYLKLKGYKACLIEMNDNKYQDKKEGNRNEISFVEKIEAWFDVDKYDEEIGMVSAFGIDMYFRQNKIPEVLKKGYDYYIYDYGCYQDRAFNKTAFVREDIKLFVVGAAVTELDYTKDVAENLFYQDAKIIFSLTAKSEEEDLLSLMNSIKTAEGSSNAKRTYFAAYSPDPFALPEESLALYEAIIPVENISKETPRAKSLFGFSKKGDKKKNGKV